MEQTLTYADRTIMLRNLRLRLEEMKRQAPKDLVVGKNERIPFLRPSDFDFKPRPNHPSGGVFGPGANGENYRRFLETLPVYVNPISTFAGDAFYHVSPPNQLLFIGSLGYIVYGGIPSPVWPPEFDYSHLKVEHELYNIAAGIGARAHFNPDVRIGLRLGWQGLLDKVRLYRDKNAPENRDFYDGLEDVVLGIQNWIGRHADAAEEMAVREHCPEIKANLEKMAAINRKLVTDPPKTFREACQWIAWFNVVSFMYNGAGAVGAIDDILEPYYNNDKAIKTIDDEEAIFHLECLLMPLLVYYQVGGTDPQGNDQTNAISFLMLEAAHRLRVTVLVTVRIHDKLNPDLLNLAVKYLFEDKTGSPNFVGDKAMNDGFVKSGFPIELARQREKCGCHWFGIPGREYTNNDCLKVNLAKVFDVALRDMMSDTRTAPSVVKLWTRYKKHLKRAVEVIAESIDFHVEHMHRVFPELVLDLCCYGPVEKGRDASSGVLEFNNFGLDGAGIATVADSFAALEQRIEKEKLLTWKKLIHHLDTNYEDAEDVRLMLKNIPRYGSGGSRGDYYAQKISRLLSTLVREKPTPKGYNMIPGLFSWVDTLSMGEVLGATPNGRFAHAPINHGANPDPGFTAAVSATAVAEAVASVQCGYGNPCPVQIELIDPGFAKDDVGLDKMTAFIRGIVDAGNTELNINIIDKERLLDAHKNPLKYPDLIVRVTGFCAHFAHMSPALRQMIIDRIVEA